MKRRADGILLARRRGEPLDAPHQRPHRLRDRGELAAFQVRGFSAGRLENLEPRHGDPYTVEQRERAPLDVTLPQIERDDGAAVALHRPRFRLGERRRCEAAQLAGRCVLDPRNVEHVRIQLGSRHRDSSPRATPLIQ